MLKRLAIITTHPIQYNAPLYALLAGRGHVQVKVFYTWGKAVLQDKFDPGFKLKIEWDIPLLDGYEYMFMENVSKKPGSHHFKGIDNPELIQAIESWNADAVLVYGWAFKSHLKVIRYFKNRVPVLFRGDSTLLNRQGNMKALARNIFLRWVYRHVDTALYAGTHNKDYFLKHGLNESQLVFVPHAVDNARFAADDEARTAEARKWRSELKIPVSSLVFLFAAKLDDNKNARLLAEAFTVIGDPDVHLIIAGNGERESTLKTEWGQYSNIHFIPFQNQSVMPVLYRVGDVFVIPSKSETWGLAINEAMACGKAILASDHCGAATDLVRNGYNGYSFRSGDMGDLVDKMKKCISGNPDVKRMGAASVDLIKDWNYEAGCMVIEALLNKDDRRVN